MTTFSEAHNLLKEFQLPLRIVCSLHLLQCGSKRLCGKANENFGFNFPVFIELIYQEVEYQNDTAGAQFKTCAIHLVNSCKMMYHREIFSFLVDIYNEYEDVSHSNEIMLLPWQKLLWLY
jgi:hypothetical protein